MKFLITRLSDKKNSPVEGAQQVGETLFGDPVFGIEVNSLEDLMKMATRARTSAPGDIGLVVWRKAQQGMSLPEDLEQFPVVEIYDDVRDSY
jgi:hypothetical protein